MSETCNKRKDYIDLARGLVILLMLVGHSGAPQLCTKMIYGFHMPFFFILSGYLYNYEKWDKCSIRKLIASKFKAYIVPYFVLCGINLFAYVSFILLSGGGTDMALSK